MSDVSGWLIGAGVVVAFLGAGLIAAGLIVLASEFYSGPRLPRGPLLVAAGLFVVVASVAFMLDTLDDRYDGRLRDAEACAEAGGHPLHLRDAVRCVGGEP